MTIRSVIAACGAYLPSRRLTNADLEKMVETSDEWIVQRTGIRERRIAADGESTGDMAIAAARQAMERAGLKGADIDGIIVATTTPDQSFPSVAIKVQQALATKIGPVFDVQAACSGFIYALAVADNFIRAGQGKCFLVIGAEKMSSILDWDDRGTAILFGDGAGAVILQAEEGKGTVADSGVLSTHLCANGNLKDILYTSGGTSTTQDSGVIIMDGKEVFRYAVQYMADIVSDVLAFNKIDAGQIDWLVPHQANIRIIEGAARKLNLGMDRVVVTVERHGNTSAASIPLALEEAVSAGKIKKGDLLLMEALGAGLTWGAALVRF